MSWGYLYQAYLLSKTGKQLTCSIRITENERSGLDATPEDARLWCLRWWSISWTLVGVWYWCRFWLLDARSQLGPGSTKESLRSTRRNDEEANHSGSRSMAGTTKSKLLLQCNTQIGGLDIVFKRCKNQK